MFELANTSLPNGLIPGTHGFATAAMTRGLPDALRQRLEALCAYTHRQAAHDERYLNENPVNWFHVVLPTGEHAVGRVAACDFDYTGRTNRLARMLVFPAREMPSTGAARVLSAEKARLSAPWEGEPRWLAPDAATATRLASSAAPVGVNPSAWTAKFGADGVALAQRFALLLEKSVRDGGKPIYFKTSAASDHDGTGLLSLFADLIDLLPPELRLAVTFSTYPDALPNGTRCHLRGAFDGDRAFAAASALQPWVDCEQGRVMHEEMLPVPKAPPRPTQPETAPSVTRASSANGTGAVQSRPQSYFPKPTQSKWLPPEKKNGERTFYLALGSFVAAVIIVFGITMMIMLKKSKKPTTAVEMPPVAVSGDSVSNEIARFEREKKELDERENRKKRDEEEKKRIADKMTQEYEDKLRQAKATNVVEIADENSHVHDKSPADVIPSKPQGLAFLQAEKVKIIGDNDFSPEFIQKYQMMKTFFYNDAQCVDITEGEEVKAKQMGVSWTYIPNPLGNAFREKCKGMFVIFYDPKTKEAFWLWQLPGSAENGEAWFGSSEKRNLRIDTFGDDKTIFEFYKKNVGTPTYTVARYESETISGGGDFAVEKTISDSTIFFDLFKPSNEAKKRERQKYEKYVEIASNNLQRVKGDVEEYNTAAKAFEDQVTKLKGAIKEKDSLNKRIREIKGTDSRQTEKKQSLKEEKDKKEKEINDYARSLEAQSEQWKFGLSVYADTLKQCNNGDQVDDRLKGKHIFDQDGKVKRKNVAEESKVPEAALNKAKKDLQSFENDWKQQWSKRVRASKFAITNVVGDKENKEDAR